MHKSYGNTQTLIKNLNTLNNTISIVLQQTKKQTLFKLNNIISQILRLLIYIIKNTK